MVHAPVNRLAPLQQPNLPEGKVNKADVVILLSGSTQQDSSSSSEIAAGFTKARQEVCARLRRASTGNSIYNEATK
jgi:hypothetical protein